MLGGGALPILILCLATNAAEGQQSNVAAIEVLPCSQQQLRGKGVNLTTTLNNVPVKNVSVCLMVNIQSWSSAIKLFRTKTFSVSLQPFDKGFGYFYHTKDDKTTNSVSFPWARVWSVSSKSWNSVCLTYNAAVRLLSVFVNGHQVRAAILSKADAIENFDLSSVILANNHSFTGRITGFNAWSWPLTTEEILGFASGKNSALVTRPDLFDWKNLGDVRLRRNCTKWIEVDPANLALHNARARNPEIVSTSPNLNYEEAFRVCKRLNAEMFYPKSVKHLDLTRNLTSKEIFEACGNKSWVPFRKVETQFCNNLSKAGAVTFEPWGKEDTDREGDCAYFDFSANKFFETECTDRLCALCQVSQDRLTFSLRSDCQELWDSNEVSSHYFMSQPQPGLFLFSGQNGKTLLSSKTKTIWAFEHYIYATNLSQVAELQNKDVGEMFGLRNWNVRLCGERSSALKKFTNVS